MSTMNVSAEEVARYYITAELHKLFPGNKAQDEIERSISQLDSKNTWRLLEALSFSYRLNGIFWRLSDIGIEWTKEIIEPNNLTLTGMNPDIDAITHSDKVNNNPLKFKEYLTKYFSEHPQDDPEKLGQFRPKGTQIMYPEIIVLEKEGKLTMIDGSNRLIAHLMNKTPEIYAYIGRKVGPSKMRVGDSTFMLLRHLYQKGDEDVKQATLTIVKELVKLSSDGKEAVQTYWVDHIRDKEFKKIGVGLLDELVEKTKEID